LIRTWISAAVPHHLGRDTDMTEPQAAPERPEPVQHVVYDGDAVVRSFMALVFEFDDRVKRDFEDRGDCLFCEIAPQPLVRAAVVQIIGTDASRPALVHVFGVGADCVATYGDGLAHAVEIWWNSWCRENLPPYGVY
jgi:hypothetical protein